MIKEIKVDDLRRMNDCEGLILQGCGGDLREWVDGINKMFTESEILQNGSKFDDVSSFQNGETTNLLFHMDGVDLNVGKLAMWRLQTHSEFGGTWLSDYVPNRLGGFIAEKEQTQSKPDCPLIGADGNIFNLMGIASRTLKDNGMKAESKEMCERITSSGSYDEALGIIGEYVNITGADEAESMGMQM